MLPSLPQINFTVHPFVSLFVCLSGIPKKVDFNVGIKIRVSTWSHLSVLHHL
jgi:hypothetical protein